MFPFKKTSILVLFCLSLGISQAWAQDSHPLTAYRNQARALVQYLDKAQIPTGYLYEYGYPAFLPTQLNGARTDTNKVDAMSWHIAYASLYSMHLYGTQSLPAPETVQTQHRNYAGSDIALPVFWIKYGSFKENALFTS